MSSRALFSNPYFLLVVAPFLWGCNAVVGKLAASTWTPLVFTEIRWVLAAVVLLPFAWKPLQRDWPLIRRHWWLLVLLGSVGMCFFNLLMYAALQYTSAINVSIEQAAMPAFIMLANFIFLSQRVRVWQIVGLVSSAVGVLVTATGGDPLSFFSGALNRGDGLMLLSCVCYAGYTFGLRWRPPIHWLSFLFVIAVVATVCAAPFALWEWQTRGWAEPSAQAWLLVVFVVIFPTIVSQICYAKGVELIGSNRAGLFINLVPVFGSALAIILLGEQFKLFHAVGLVLVLGGIALAERFASR